MFVIKMFMRIGIVNFSLSRQNMIMCREIKCRELSVVIEVSRIKVSRPI